MGTLTHSKQQLSMLLQQRQLQGWDLLRHHPLGTLAAAAAPRRQEPQQQQLQEELELGCVHLRAQVTFRRPSIWLPCRQLQQPLQEQPTQGLLGMILMSRVTAKPMHSWLGCVPQQQQEQRQQELPLQGLGGTCQIRLVLGHQELPRLLLLLLGR